MNDDDAPSGSTIVYLALAWMLICGVCIGMTILSILKGG